MHFITAYIPLILFVWLPIMLYYWALHKSFYWRRKKIPSILGIPIFGNLGQFLTFRKPLPLIFNDMYFDAETKDTAFVGIHVFYKPVVLIKHPDLIGRVMIKDFSSFQNRYAAADEHSDVLGATSLPFIKNPRWKQLRSRFTPFFSISKMRQMFHLMQKVAIELNEMMLSAIHDEQTKVFRMDPKNLCGRYTVDVIASCAFGIDVNSLKYPENQFFKSAARIFDFTLYRALEFFCIFYFPEFVSLFRFKLLSKQSNEFLRNSIYSVMREREKSGIARQDLIDTLITLKNEDKGTSNSKTKLVFEGDVLVAQAAIFFTAGYETSSTGMAFTLYELCWKPEIQKRLRAEIQDVFTKSKGDPTYDNIQSMIYLDMVILETLRMYPTLSFLERECTNEEGYSLQPYDNFVIPKGMQIIVPIYPVQRDPQFFPDPDMFDPERFSVKNRRNILPHTFLPFGIGPRACAGVLFGIIQTKIGLVHFLKNHFVAPSDQTPKVMVLDPKSIVTKPKGDIILNVIRDPMF